MRLAALSFVVVAAAACPPPFPAPPKDCDPAGPIAGKPGCLSDEVCIDFRCQPRPKCNLDEDCGDAAFECVLPAQICELREGFGTECSPEAPCGPNLFCALGVCRELSGLNNCARREDCGPGEGCDKINFQCIPEGPCTLVADFPELACDPAETCDVFSERCVLGCQEECTPETVEDDCGPNQRCDAACRCVQCINDEDCGAGLVCDERTGFCQSEDICFSDEDCDSPLICVLEVQQCQVAPPACFSDFDCGIGQICDIGSGRCLLAEGPCALDIHEPANTPATAEPLLEPGENERTITGLNLCPNDDDVYSVELLEGDLLVVTIDPEIAAAHTTVWLLDATAELSLRFAETPPFGNGVIQYVAQSNETVFLRINALEAQTDYTLIAERLSGAPCQEDFFEPNDELTTPAPAFANVALAGTVCPFDEDYFTINVAAGEALEATLAFDGIAGDLDVAFLDQSGAVIAQAAGSASPEVLRQRFNLNTDVIVRVRGFGTDTGEYQLTLVREPPFVCTVDAAEDDDNLGEATVLALGEEIIDEPRTMCLDDRDFFVVPLEDFERLVVVAQYDDADVEITIDVFDALGEDLLETNPPSTGGSALSYDAVGDETVVVRVTGTGGAIGPYTLSLLRENQLDCAPDAAEPNNVVAVPVPEPGTLLSICENDQDLFAIEGTAGKKLIVDASFRQADGDIDLLLLGLDGDQILAVADGTSDGEHLEFLLPLDAPSDDGPFYTLRVFSLTSGASARYSLSVQEVTP